MIIAGEVSGDLHASRMIAEFTRVRPGARFLGVGGEKMKAEGCELLYNVEEVAFLGFVEVIAHLPFIKRMMKRLLDECQQRRPDAVVLVDYPGFNLRFADRLRRLPGFEKIPILYYISPQVWAWHASRVPKIAKLVDRIAVIFDFEKPIYDAVGLKADFVGHPLLETIRTETKRKDFCESISISPDDPLLALLPGSRLQEVKRLFPLFLRSFAILKNEIQNLRAAVGCSPALDIAIYKDILHEEGLLEEVQVIQGNTSDLQSHADAALVASGTATLETAIMQTPMIMAYKVAPLTYWIGRFLIKIPNIALVNVVAGERIVPELIQGDATPNKIASELAILFQNPERRKTMVDDLSRVREKLGEPGASKRVADILYSMVS